MGKSRHIAAPKAPLPKPETLFNFHVGVEPSIANLIGAYSVSAALRSDIKQAPLDARHAVSRFLTECHQELVPLSTEPVGLILGSGGKSSDTSMLVVGPWSFTSLSAVDLHGNAPVGRDEIPELLGSAASAILNAPNIGVAAILERDRTCLVLAGRRKPGVALTFCNTSSTAVELFEAFVERCATEATEPERAKTHVISVLFGVGKRAPTEPIAVALGQKGVRPHVYLRPEPLLVFAATAAK